MSASGAGVAHASSPRGALQDRYRVMARSFEALTRVCEVRGRNIFARDTFGAPLDVVFAPPHMFLS